MFRPKQAIRLIAIFAILVSLSLSLASSAAASGTWQSCPPNPTNDYNQGIYLLTDGSVLIEGTDFYDGVNHNDTWYRLTPDSKGSYANGTWTELPSSPWGALDFPSFILSNGNFWMVGGEYTTNTDAHAQQHAQMYDPVTNTWLAASDAPHLVMDTGAAMLENGTILVGTDDYSDVTQLYNPTTDAWSISGTELDGNGDEAGWQLLPDGSVFDCLYSGPGLESERYLPSTGEWIPAADSPVTMSDYGEEGALVYLENGEILCISDNGPTALYTPPTTLTGLGSWSLGPTLPNSDNGADTPAAIETNGLVYCVAASGSSLYGPADFYEYDPGTNTFSTAPSPTSYQPSLSYATKLLELPNGQLLFIDFSQNLEVYTPTGSPDPTWRPAVSSVSSNGDGSYTLTGTQLTGRSYGDSYGDDFMNSTDFPIVYLTDGAGNVYYCRSYNFNTRAIWTGSTPETCDFTPPSGLANGTYNLYVSVNGVSSSTAYTFQVGTVSNTPVIISLVPSSTTVDSPGFTLQVNGSNFATNAEVDWNGTALATTYVSTTELQATVPSGDLTATGQIPITVTNPGPFTSSPATFTINPNQPAVLTSLSPGAAIVGSPGFTLTVNGTNFLASSVVDWNGTALATTYVSGTQLTATVPASNIAAIAPVTITVANPDANLSNGLPFTINPIPAAVITGLSPEAVVMGSPGFTLTINGLSFISGCTVYWNGSALATTFVSSTELTVTVPAENVASVQASAVTVVNQGANPSNPYPFIIDPIHTYQAGLQLFSVPYDYSSTPLSTALGYTNPTLAVWVPAQSQYVLSPTTPADALRLGQGYWARMPKTEELETLGTAAPTNAPFSITLGKGWNMIGVPFPSAVAISTLTVQNGSNQMTFAQAVTAGLVGAAIYSYPAGSTNYASQTTGSLDPYLGYWVYTPTGCTLLIPAPAGG